MATREIIDAILGDGRLAKVGVSRNGRDFTRGLFRELRRRGYDVIPVYPGAAEMEGQPCFARLQDIRPSVTAALLMLTPNNTEQVVADCAEASIRRVWIH